MSIRKPRCSALGGVIPIDVTIADGCDGPPEGIFVFGVHDGNRGVRLGSGNQREDEAAASLVSTM